MFLLICLMSVATWTVTSGQRDDGMVINLAARQRMQVQKIAKEALVYAHLVREGQSADSMAEARDKGAQAEANAAEASRALELAKEEEAKTADLLSRMTAPSLLLREIQNGVD